MTTQETKRMQGAQEARGEFNGSRNLEGKCSRGHAAVLLQDLTCREAGHRGLCARMQRLFAPALARGDSYPKAEPQCCGALSYIPSVICLLHFGLFVLLIR